MIRSIDAHLALKKLRKSVPEVNAPEVEELKDFKECFIVLGFRLTS